MEQYDHAFYTCLRSTARKSAQQVVPIILRFVKPRTVIDIGCGTGTWLSVFAEYGVVDCLGVDGEMIPIDLLEIPNDRFIPFDLTKPYRCDRRFDLVLSLEVAEHLAEDCAQVFVTSLTQLGPVVLFSAAIPGQGGTCHLNEQWPDYWAALFRRCGFVPIDCVRRLVWDNDEVSWWYSQNTLVFCDEHYLQHNPILAQEFQRSRGSPLSVVHPKKYLEVANFWTQITEIAIELRQHLPEGKSVIVVDDGVTECDLAGHGNVIPFLERNGVYFGRPADSEIAIRELQRLQSVADFLAIMRPAFWWVEFYSDWYRYLTENFEMTLHNDRLIVFDLQSESSPRSVWSSQCR